MSLGSSEDRHSSSRLTRLTSARFRGRAPGPVSGRLYESIRLEDRHQRSRFPAAFRPPAFASWASCSRQGIRLSLRSAYRQRPQGATGPDAVSTFHTHEIRAGSGALFTPEATVSTRSSMSPRPPSADFHGQPLCLPGITTRPGELPSRGINEGSFAFTQSALPLTCDTRSERVPLGFSLSFAPSHYWPRTSGRGPVTDTDRELRLGHCPTSNRRTPSTRATSCRTALRHLRMLALDASSHIRRRHRVNGSAAIAPRSMLAEMDGTGGGPGGDARTRRHLCASVGTAVQDGRPSAEWAIIRESAPSGRLPRRCPPGWR